VSVGVWEPFIFVNPDPFARPLSEYLGDLPEQVASLGVDMARIARDSYRLVLDRVIDCNWKVAVENGMECYHCGVAHPGFAATVDLNRWHISMGGNCVTQGTRLRRATSSPHKRGTQLAEAVTNVALSDDGTDLALFHFVFPNQTVQVWPGPANSFSIGRFIPVGPERVRRWYARYWTSDVPQDLSQESWGFTMQVANEDRALCEGVQKAMHSGAYTRGRFQLVSSSVSEHGAQRMNQLLLRHLRAHCD
jgi:choline monooxygenase